MIASLKENWGSKVPWIIALVSAITSGNFLYKWNIDIQISKQKDEAVKVYARLWEESKSATGESVQDRNCQADAPLPQPLEQSSRKPFNRYGPARIRIDLPETTWNRSGVRGVSNGTRDPSGYMGELSIL